MSSPISDKAINELYQQRKHQVVAPTIDVAALTKESTKTSFLSQKVSTIFALSCIVSFSVFAIMSFLNQPLEQPAKNIQVVVHRDIQLDIEKKEDKPDMQLAAIEPIPKPPKVVKLPIKEKLESNIINKTPIIGEVTLDNQLNVEIIEVDSNISTHSLAVYLTHKVAPKYPIKAQQKKIQGRINLSYQISPQGEVEAIKVINSSSKLFIKPATKALSQWRYTQPTHSVKTKTEPNTYEIEFIFKLNKK